LTFGPQEAIDLLGALVVEADWLPARVVVVAHHVHVLSESTTAQAIAAPIYLPRVSKAPRGCNFSDVDTRSDWCDVICGIW
jgi:hypothetical protein